MNTQGHVRWQATSLGLALGFAACGGGGVARADPGGASGAAEPRPDKSGYSLLRPVPDALLREMSTDRPDQTESPYTVDAGHFQVEADLASVTLDVDRSGGGEVRTTAFGTSLNLKAGLLNSVDLQCVLEPYRRERVEDVRTGSAGTASGFGEVATRLKVNLWGNDGGATAMAVMPFVKWPLPESGLRNGETEGGLIVILGIELPAGWSATLMAECDGVGDADGGHEAEFVHSVTFGHALAGSLAGYVEFYTVTSTAPGFDWQGQVDVGFTLGLDANTQLDLGCNFGVTPSAPDFQPFLGISFRY